MLKESKYTNTEIKLEGVVNYISDLYMWEGHDEVSKGYLKHIKLKVFISNKTYNYECTLFNDNIKLIDDLALFDVVRLKANVIGRFKKKFNGKSFYSVNVVTLAVTELKIIGKVKKEDIVERIKKRREEKQFIITKTKENAITNRKTIKEG